MDGFKGFTDALNHRQASYFSPGTNLHLKIKKAFFLVTLNITFNYISRKAFISLEMFILLPLHRVFCGL